jgi:glycosyltransferase involved in cell wall biosynthesis
MGFINDPLEVEKVVSFIVAAGADYTFLAVGSPQQEFVARRLIGTDARGVGLCIGASIEFLSGDVQRAPKAMQKLGIEWLYRFLCEPQRLFRRYFIESPKIIAILLRARLARGVGTRKSEAVLKLANVGKPTTIYVDYTHVQRRASGIERITRELFSLGALAPLPIRPFHGPKGRIGMIAAQMVGLPLCAMLRHSDVFVFPGYPPSPYFNLIPRRSVLYVHDVFLLTRPENLNATGRYYMKPNFRLAMKHFRHFLTNSEDTASKLKQFCNPAAHIQCYRPKIRNVFELQVGDRVGRPSDPATIRIVAVGTIEPRKNYLAAADICDALAMRLGPKIELHVIGRAGWGDDAARLARRANVTLHGFVSDTDARELIQASDLLICTSYEEGLGLPLLETQYAGLAVVAPDDRVFHEVLGTSGIFIDVSAPTQAAEVIAGVIAAPDWRLQYVARSEGNLRRWNDLADQDRRDVIAFLGRLSEAST